jgi:hypothetical protein
MPDAHDSVEEKVLAIFREVVGDRAERLLGGKPSFEALRTFENALVADYSPEIAADVAFHLADWNSDAAFLVAVYLFPERFTPEELRAGVDMLLVHAPNHLAAAATLVDHPIEDIFEVGVPQNPPEQT